MQELLGLSIGEIYIVPTLVLLLMALHKYPPSRKEMLLVCLVAASFLMLSLITQSIKNVNMYIFYAPTLLICFCLGKSIQLIERLTTLLSWFSLIAIAMSGIALIYGLVDGSPLLSFAMANGKESHLYLSALSSDVQGKVIRSAFIYDESGALSFVLCITVILREITGRSTTRSMLVLLGGLVTFSLMHAMIIAIFFFMRTHLKAKILSSLIVLMLFLTTSASPLLQFYYDRFHFIEAVNPQSGFGNRSIQIENFRFVFEKDPNIVLFGNYRCHERSEGRCREHGDITSSPVSPVYWGGLLMLVAQVITHGCLLYGFIVTRHKFEALALSLLILQRPYFAFPGYALLVYLPLVAIFLRREEREHSRQPLMSTHLGASGPFL